jgi:hypothetical protein
MPGILWLLQSFQGGDGRNCDADSAPGHGWRFVVELPAIRAGEAEAAQTRSGRMEASGHRSFG